MASHVRKVDIMMYQLLMPWQVVFSIQERRKYTEIKFDKKYVQDTDSIW